MVLACIEALQVPAKQSRIILMQSASICVASHNVTCHKEVMLLAEQQLSGSCQLLPLTAVMRGGGGLHLNQLVRLYLCARFVKNCGQQHQFSVFIMARQSETNLLIHSMCFNDAFQLQEEEALQLVDSMLEYDALSQLLYRLRHFNEAVPEEAEAVQKLLSVFENMIEVKPDVAEQLVQLGDAKTGFLRYSSLLQST